MHASIHCRYELLHFDTYLARTYPLHFHVGNSEGLQNKVGHTTADEAIQVHMKVSLTDCRALSSVNRSANELAPSSLSS